MTGSYSEEEIRNLVSLLIEISNLRMKLTHAPDAVLEANAFGETDADGEEIVEHALNSDENLASIIESFGERLGKPEGLAELMTKPLASGQEKALHIARGEARELDAYVAKRAH